MAVSTFRAFAPENNPTPLAVFIDELDPTMLDGCGRFDR
jgi:hypothetical protein